MRLQFRHQKFQADAARAIRKSNAVIGGFLYGK